MKKKKEIQRYRTTIPMIGSKLGPCRECSHPECIEGRKWAATICSICGQNASGAIVDIWPDGHVSHVACQLRMLEIEESLLNRAGLIDAAAKTARLTIEGFKGLPKYDRWPRIMAEAEKVGLLPIQNFAEFPLKSDQLD